MTKVRTALIIGGGIAGPATAMALHKAGIEATVYEAQPHTAEGSGAFLTVASNGIDALRVLGGDRPVVEAGFPTPGITLRSCTGKHLGEARTGLTLDDGTTSHTIKRAALYRALHDEATGRGLRVEHAKRLARAEQTADGVRAIFTDGSDAVGDVLVGCDGVHSAVRRIIDPAAPAPTYAGLITNAGYVRGLTVDAEPGSYEMIFGKRAFFGYAAAPDGEVWWFANVPRHDEPARGELEAVGAEAWRQQLLDLYTNDAGPATELIDATLELTPMSVIHALPRLPVWHNDRMIVIGDAAHAPSRRPAKARRWPSRTRSCWPRVCAISPAHRRRSPRSKRHGDHGSSASSNGPPAPTTAKRPGPSDGQSATP